MATAVPTKPTPAAARDAAVEQAILAAANKVRANDLLSGAAAAAVLVLGYLAAMVVLDKLFALPDWVRQLGLFGFLVGLAAVGYFLVVRPLRRRINPRYIARKIEETLPDGKNVLINWVDLQNEQLPGSVKAAVGANAAVGMADADIDTATSSRRAMWLGGTAAGLVLVLALLFLLFSGPQFLSLVQRAVVPFKPAAIATQTTITIDEPEGGDVTITDGQPLSIAVSLGGRVPNPDGPDKARLLVRYNPEADDAIELPLTATESSREFRTDLGRSTILNGFWYRVAAGDAVTPEYHVTVRTRPMLSEYTASYEYPAYLKWPADVVEGTKLRAIRGTVVTLTAKANRAVDSATLVTAGVDGGREIVRGEVAGSGRDQVRFRLKLKENGTYRIDFDPAGPETTTATANYPIEVEVDYAPVVEITKPEEEEIQLPLNGLLAVDGTVKDDHGIAGVELRFKLVGNDAVTIQSKPFREGKPLVREKDNTLITDLSDYKDSVKLDELTDDTGKPLSLKADDVLEYWIAATDNCTEPAANVGESAHKRVRLAPPVTEPEQKQQQSNRQEQRKQDEQKSEQKLDDKLKNETRPQDQARNPDRPPQGQPPPEGQQPKEGDPNGGNEGNPDGKKPDTPPEGQPKEGQPKGEDEQPQDGQPKEGQPQDGKGGDTPPNDQDLQKKADELKKKIEEQKEQEKKEAGSARGDGDTAEGKETPPDAQTKPQDSQPNGEGQKGAADPKNGPPPEEMGKPGEGNAGEGKDAGKLTDPERSAEKTPPPTDPKGEQKPIGEQPKNAPKEGSEAGTAKESKEGGSPKPQDPTQPNDPMEGTKPDQKDGSAGAGRGAEPPQDPNAKPQDPMGGGTDTPKPGGEEKKVDPKDLGGSKPKGEPERGTAKPEPQQQGGSEGSKPDPMRDASGAKGEAPPEPAKSKDAPPKGEGNQPMPPEKGPPADAGTEKQPPKEGMQPGEEGAAEPKGEGKKPEQPMGGGTDPNNPMKDPMGGQGKPDDKGTAKPSNVEKDPKPGQGKPGDETQPMGGGTDPMKDPMGGGQGEQPKDPMKDPMQQPMGGGSGEKKLDREEVEQAVKDLDSKDEKARQAAQEKLDKAIGEENRKEIEQMQKDLKSDDKATREAAQKKLQDMVEKAQDAAKNDPNQKPRELTEQEKQELADAAKKLTSKDEAERKAAEQKLDEAIGKQNREQLQQDMQDLQGDDPQKAEQARKRLEEQLEQARKNGNDPSHDDRRGDLGGGNLKKPGQPIDPNLENQLKSRELALDDFKKYRGDKQFLRENNLTEEEYDSFLKEYEKSVQALRDEVAEQRVNPTARPNLPPTVGRNDGSTERVQGRGDADKLNTSGGPAVAPPGFADAIKRFTKEASKQK